MSIEVRHLSKRFGSFTALDDVSLSVGTGELVGLLGPSGSGKTTLLRILAGLERPDAGEVHLGGEEATRQPASERRVGFVFQHYALFRHLTVFENVAFGLRVRPRAVRQTESQIRARVHELLQLVQLDNMGARHPSQLSGGQRQRVALARALAVEPRLLLLDEPFGALDARVRKDLRRWLRALHDKLEITTLFVTHDQEEALELSDRVVIMQQGRIEQVGTPESVYRAPVTPFVYRFLGDVNLFHCRVEGGKAYFGDTTIELPGHVAASSNGATTLYVRPHVFDITLQRTSGRQFQAVVRAVNPAGPLVRVELESEWGGHVRVELSQDRHRALSLRPGAEVFVAPRVEELFVAG
jgi:sulfate transport system ATP-binding protein